MSHWLRGDGTHPYGMQVQFSSLDIVEESVDCNAVADKTIIAKLLRNPLLYHFDDFSVDGEVAITEK